MPIETVTENATKTCCAAGDKTKPNCGPGYKTPLDAMRTGPREKILYTTVTHNPESQIPDYLGVVDVDPQSKTYCQVISKVKFPNLGDEVHHTGWNACSSCFGDSSASRSHLIVPCLNSDRVYIVDTKTDPLNPKLAHTIEAADLRKMGVSMPHTSHCLADGNIMISTIGDENGNHKGNFILLDGKTFQLKDGLWSKSGGVPYGYDYWYQPKYNTMISTSWGAPKCAKGGFVDKHVEQNEYGSDLYIWNWNERTLRQTITLDRAEGGSMPLEMRFLHDPNSVHAFVGCAHGSSVYHIWPEHGPNEKWTAKKVILVPDKSVANYTDPTIGGLATDILISLDDRFLFISLWLHGDVRVYNIEDPSSPKLVGQCFVGNKISKDGPIKVIKDEEGHEQPEPRYVKGRRIDGGPQMMQLSLDGKRLYVTTSLYSIWDKQYYPDLIKNGGVMMQLDVDTITGKLSVNENFLVDFGKDPEGPGLPHEMRYPGGDVTSDIWL